MKMFGPQNDQGPLKRLENTFLRHAIFFEIFLARGTVFDRQPTGSRWSYRVDIGQFYSG